LKYNGDRKQAGNCNRPSGMAGDFIESQGSQWTLELEKTKKKKKKKKKEAERGRRRRI
jgi:hypothetical protein